MGERREIDADGGEEGNAGGGEEEDADGGEEGNAGGFQAACEAVLRHQLNRNTMNSQTLIEQHRLPNSTNHPDPPITHQVAVVFVCEDAASRWRGWVWGTGLGRWQ